MLCDRLAGGTSKRSHRVPFAGHGAVRPVGSLQNDIWCERWIRTVLAECLYLGVYARSDERRRDLERFVAWYNEVRPHLGIGGRTPRQRLSEKLAA
jgi:transposase InsO family protein